LGFFGTGTGSQKFSPVTETVVEAIVERVVARLAPAAVSRTTAELRTALQGVEREISNLTRAIAKGGELESLIKELGACEKRRSDLRASIEGRQRVQGQQVDAPKLEAAVRHRVNNWRSLLTRRSAHGRQILREMLAGSCAKCWPGRSRSSPPAGSRRVEHHVW